MSYLVLAIHGKGNNNHGKHGPARLASRHFGEESARAQFHNLIHPRDIQGRKTQPVWRWIQLVGPRGSMKVWQAKDTKKERELAS